MDILGFSFNYNFGGLLVAYPGKWATDCDISSQLHELVMGCQNGSAHEGECCFMQNLKKSKTNTGVKIVCTFKETE